MSRPKPVPKLVIVCGSCGAQYLDPGGDASPWRCRVCEAVLSRQKAA
jgi:hypothetical protein